MKMMGYLRPVLTIVFLRRRRSAGGAEVACIHESDVGESNAYRF